MTLISALRKWVAEVEAEAGDGEIPSALVSSYVRVKEALEEYDRGEIHWTEQDLALLKSYRITA